MRLVVAIVLVLATLTCARAQPTGSTLKPEAQAHYDRGLKLYERNQFAEAIVELQAGLAIDPQPELLYALGQAERKSGHCDRAIEHFQACMALLKNPTAQAAVKVQIERCLVEKRPTVPAEQGAPPPAVEPPAHNAVEPPARNAVELPAQDAVEPPAGQELAPARQPEVVAAAPPPRSWIRDPLGGALTAIGVGGIAAGAALVAVARNEAAHGNDSYQRFADAQNATALWTGGIVTLSVGGALVAAGIIRYAVVAARRREHRRVAASQERF